MSSTAKIISQTKKIINNPGNSGNTTTAGKTINNKLPTNIIEKNKLPAQITKKEIQKNNNVAQENNFDIFLKNLCNKINTLTGDLIELREFREKLTDTFELDEIEIVDAEIAIMEQELFNIREKYEDKDRYYKEEILVIQAKLQKRSQILNAHAGTLLKKNQKLAEFFLKQQQELGALFGELIKNVE